MNLRAGFDNIVSGFQVDPSGVPAGVVRVENVSKRFRKHTVAKKSYSTVKTTFMSRLFSRRFPQNNFVAALADISINIEPGQAVGIIGGNGSGKSTLLKLISGIYRPDTGRIVKSGKISALIELGAGFHPDFTGRENVYLGGVMYGLTKKQIEQRIDDIVRYAQLEDFIDDPVRTYSSGMYMRLGFSLAVHTDPDILLIDEVLAVGDASFIHRCHETISEFRRQGKTLILVTHDLESVARWCDEAIWLEKGVVRERGEPRFVIDSYLGQVDAGEEKELETANAETEHDSTIEGASGPGNPASKRWGNREVEISAVRMFGERGDAKWVFQGDEDVTVEVDYTINSVCEDLVFGVGILRADGLVIHGNNTEIEDVPVPLPDPELAAFPLHGTYRYRISRLSLVEDSYFLDVAAHGSDGTPYDYHHLRFRFSVRTHLRQAGVYNPEHEWLFEPGYAVLEEKRQHKAAGR